MPLVTYTLAGDVKSAQAPPLLWEATSPLFKYFNL